MKKTQSTDQKLATTSRAAPDDTPIADHTDIGHAPSLIALTVDSLIRSLSNDCICVSNG